MKVLIADDEIEVLKGLKCIINWHKHGFIICGEAQNGDEALKLIQKHQPDLVLLDIRMPKYSGLDVVRLAKETSFSGKFIILSGYSDFNYAKTAMQYGVDFYLTKPIDEDELEDAVITVRDNIIEEQKKATTLSSYKEKAKKQILQDVLKNTLDYNAAEIHDLYETSDIYQIILYANYNQDNFHNIWDFANLLRVSNQSQNTFEHLNYKGQDIILLKGKFALQRFESLLDHYRQSLQKGSPLDSLFLTYGRIVYQLSDVHISYNDAICLMNRRFFCQQNQHILSFSELPKFESFNYYLITAKNIQEFSQKFITYIQAHNRGQLNETLLNLEKYLYNASNNVNSIKHCLADILIQIKSTLTHIYNTITIPFPANATIIELIEKKYYLYEIFNFFSEQFAMYMNAIGSFSSENIIDDILHYIACNYRQNLKLESIAPIFGYNSSYLGKIFNRKTGKSFNSYLDQIRINESKKLLGDNSLKVYEIAERIGYKNVDYFHKKFRRYVGISPLEYRKGLL